MGGGAAKDNSSTKHTTYKQVLSSEPPTSPSWEFGTFELDSITLHAVWNNGNLFMQPANGVNAARIKKRIKSGYIVANSY